MAKYMTWLSCLEDGYLYHCWTYEFPKKCNRIYKTEEWASMHARRFGHRMGLIEDWALAEQTGSWEGITPRALDVVYS